MNRKPYHHSDDITRPGHPPESDPALKALLSALADTLEAARVTVDDLARDLGPGHWRGLPLPHSHQHVLESNHPARLGRGHNRPLYHECAARGRQR